VYDEHEAELVEELLAVTDEEELDQFLGKLARGVVRGASRFIRSPVGRTLGGVLRKVAKAALPTVGGAIGTFIAPGAGTLIGRSLGSMASGLLEAEEAEALDEREAEYESARRFVRFARAAYRNAARNPAAGSTRSVVRTATVDAARRHAPVLVRDRFRARRGRRRAVGHGYPALSWPVPTDSDGDAVFGRRGSWERRGDSVVLTGL